VLQVAKHSKLKTRVRAAKFLARQPVWGSTLPVGAHKLASIHFQQLCIRVPGYNVLSYTSY